MSAFADKASKLHTETGPLSDRRREQFTHAFARLDAEVAWIRSYAQAGESEFDADLKDLLSGDKLWAQLAAGVRPARQALPDRAEAVSALRRLAAQGRSTPGCGPGVPGGRGRREALASCRPRR